MSYEPKKRAAANAVGIARLRELLLRAVLNGMTLDEMQSVARHADANALPFRVVGGSGVRLERVRIRRPGKLTESLVYRVQSCADAYALIIWANHCADAMGYEPISEDKAAEILSFYPGAEKFLSELSVTKDQE